MAMHTHGQTSDGRRTLTDTMSAAVVAIPSNRKTIDSN